VLVVRSMQRELGARRQHKDFLSAVTHELRSPIASASLYVESILLGRAEGAKATRYLHSVKLDLERLRQQVDGLLAAARVRQEHPRVQPQELDLCAHVRGTIARLGQAGLPEGTRLEFEGSDELLARTDPQTIVLGSRMADAGAMPKARLRANRTANFFISWAAGQWIDDTQCGFRVYPLSVFAAVRLRPRRHSGFVMESEVLIEACRAGYRVVPAAVPALYGPVLQRPSHFRPVFDIAWIVIMVTGKLAAWGFYPPGLVRSQRQRRARRRAEETCIRKRDAAV